MKTKHKRGRSKSQRLSLAYNTLNYETPIFC